MGERSGILPELVEFIMGQVNIRILKLIILIGLFWSNCNCDKEDLENKYNSVKPKWRWARSGKVHPDELPLSYPAPLGINRAFSSKDRPNFGRRLLSCITDKECSDLCPNRKLKRGAQCHVTSMCLQNQCHC